MSKNLEAPYIIIKGSNGRFYHKRNKETTSKFTKTRKNHVYLTENAYNVEEEQKLIELDENNRGQPPPKKQKIRKSFVSFISSKEQVKNTPFVLIEDEDIETGTTKPAKSNNWTVLSRFHVRRNDIQSWSHESITDEDTQPLHRTSTQKIHSEVISRSSFKPNIRRDNPGGLSISEIFKNEFIKESSQFQSYFKELGGNRKLSESSILTENELERKSSVFDKLKKLALSAKNFITLKKESEDFREIESINNNTLVLMKDNKTCIEIPTVRSQIVTQYELATSASFPEASILQDRCKTIVSSIMLQVKKMASSKVPFNNKVHSQNATTDDTSKIKIPAEDTVTKESKVEVIISNETNFPNTLESDETSKVSENPECPSPQSPSEVHKDIANSVYLNHRVSLRSSRLDTLYSESSICTENEEDFYTDEDEIEYSDSARQSCSESNIVPSSYEIPRRHYGKKDKMKRDKILMENLKRHFDRMREEKSRKKYKPNFFQKVIKLFSRKKESIKPQRKDKLSLREILLKRLGFKRSIKARHTNSIVVYREKRRKFFHEQNEFFEDSLTAYGQIKMPVYHRSDKVLDGEMDSHSSFPLSHVIPCTVSDGVFHERKRKLGQSRIGMREVIKDVGNDNSTMNSVTATVLTSNSDIRGILKNKVS